MYTYVRTYVLLHNRDEGVGCVGVCLPPFWVWGQGLEEVGAAPGLTGGTARLILYLS